MSELSPLTVSMMSLNSVTSDQLFSLQARRTPNAIAATHGDQRMTYSAMDKAAGCLAGALRARGIGAGHRVGLATEPGLLRGIALLGVLRSGAAYVPLDPAYPRERLEFMATDAELSLIIATKAAIEVFEGMAAPVVDPAQLVAECIVAVDSASTPEGTAYLIYTSGSTGTPKGVVMPHRALANLLTWQMAEEGFDRPTRTLQFTRLSFDVHFQEMFATWVTGGELVYLDDAVRRDPTRLLSVLTSASIERIFLPFVALQQIAEVAITYGTVPDALREVVTAGEQLQANEAIRDFFGRIPECRLHNHYGPSETHVVTAHTLTGPPHSWPLLPPIGRPIANTIIHLLDESDAPVGEGAMGELCVSGLALADGYWRRPDITSARFVPAPGGGLMYRTGDCARLDADGRIEFLGRIDNQVKIRGHRVEPGEVEAAIRLHPAVRDCAVAAQKDSIGGTRLAAYLVLDSGRPDVRATAAALRQEKLSEWQGVWERTYGMEVQESAADLDLRGWVDSYSGQPIPEADMGTWAEGTAKQVLDLNPRRVLEIGAGSGLMLFRIAPSCVLYHATDFSRHAVELLRKRVEGRELCPDLRLDVAAADEIDRFESDGYDLVLLNSVTQHFPTLDYLVSVLKSATRLVGDGCIFVGDVTSAVLRETFYASIEGARARSSDALSGIRSTVEQRLGQEEELVVDPAFFVRLAEWVPGVASVEVRLKPGRYRNELTRFRYDVLIRMTSAVSEVTPTYEIDWEAGTLELERLRHLLALHPEEVVVVKGIPNARVVEMYAGTESLRSGEGTTVADWRAVTAERSTLRRQQALEPQDVLDLAKALGREALATWGERPDEFDAVLSPQAGLSYVPTRATSGSTGPLDRLASQPLNAALMQHVEAELRERLTASMPEYMVPDRFELLSRLPTTPSGKLDRAALPEPGRHRPALPHDYVAPKGETEVMLAGVWSEILGIDRVGATDSFFDIGGNSILTVRLAALIRKKSGRDLQLIALFNRPTVRALASLLDESPEALRTGGDSPEDRAQKQRKAFSNNQRFRRK